MRRIYKVKKGTEKRRNEYKRKEVEGTKISDKEIKETIRTIAMHIRWMVEKNRGTIDKNTARLNK